MLLKMTSLKFSSSSGLRTKLTNSVFKIANVTKWFFRIELQVGKVFRGIKHTLEKSQYLILTQSWRSFDTKQKRLWRCHRHPVVYFCCRNPWGWKQPERSNRILSSWQNKTEEDPTQEVSSMSCCRTSVALTVRHGNRRFFRVGRDFLFSTSCLRTTSCLQTTCWWSILATF